MNDAINSFKLNKGQTKLLSLIFCCKIMYSKCLKQKVWYVIVYSIGCPNPEYFGERCNLPCPTTCENRRCHIETGKCFGCKDGYNGSTCNIRKYCWLTSKIRFMQSIISFIMQFAYQYYSNFYIILFFFKYFPMENTLNWVKMKGVRFHTDTYFFPCCVLAHLESASKLHFWSITRKIS